MVIETTDKIGCENGYFGQATDKSVLRTTFGRLDHKPKFPLGQQINRQQKNPTESYQNRLSSLTAVNQLFGREARKSPCKIP
jgi:hypothetical protein